MAEEQKRSSERTIHFEGYWRDWNPLPGHEPPPGKLFEMRILDYEPTIVVCAGTIDEAWSRLQEALAAEQAHKAKRARVLALVTAKPNLDDVEIADELGEDLWDVSVMLRYLKLEGLVVDGE